MAITILDYFNSKPNGVGISTYQTTENATNILLDKDTLENYKVLINSVSTNDSGFGQAFNEGMEASGKKYYPSLLMHAADIFWGDATFNDEAANEKLSQIGLYKNGRIRTTRDILAILEYLLTHMGEGGPVVPTFTISPKTATLTQSTKTATFTASGTGINTSDVSWEISNTSDFSISAPSGKTTVVTLLKTTQADGTTTMQTGSSSDKVILAASFTRGAESKYSATLTAQYTGCSNVTASITGTVAPKNAGAYEWTVAESKTLPEGLTLEPSDNTATVENTTYEDIDLPADTIKVTNKNGGEAFNTAVKVLGKPKVEEKTYYYFIGDSSNFAPTIFDEDEAECKTEFKSNIDSLVKSFDSVKTSSTLYNEYGDDVYPINTPIINGTSSWFPCIIGPTVWADTMQKKIYNVRANAYMMSSVQDSQSFTIDSVEYKIIVLHAQCSKTIELIIK